MNLLKDFTKNLIAFFKRPAKVKDDNWTRIELEKALHRNGVITERARQKHRSLTYVERQIISAVRSIATRKFSPQMITMIEMEGQVNKKLIFEPIKVKAKFAYWWSGEYGFAPQPSYLIMESNHPALPAHGNVGLDELKKNDIKVPSTPDFKRWVSMGRPIFRGA